MAEIRRAYVRDGVVQSVYFDDEAVIATKLAAISGDLVACDEATQSGWLYAAGDFVDPASLLPPLSVRQKRRAEYFEALRVEPGDDQLTVLGDQVDKILQQIEVIRAAAGVARTPEFDALIKTVIAIKTRLPKPAPGG